MFVNMSLPFWQSTERNACGDDRLRFRKSTQFSGTTKECRSSHTRPERESSGTPAGQLVELNLAAPVIFLRDRYWQNSQLFSAFWMLSGELTER
jgi:hypothetical protein